MAAGLTYPTCDAFPVGGTSLARYEAVELNEGDVSADASLAAMMN